MKKLGENTKRSCMCGKMKTNLLGRTSEYVLLPHFYFGIRTAVPQQVSTESLPPASRGPQCQHHLKGAFTQQAQHFPKVTGDTQCRLPHGNESGTMRADTPRHTLHGEAITPTTSEHVAQL